MDCLIVEDDEILTQMFLDGLEDSCARLDAAHTVSDGLRRLRTHKYDLLLLDFHLPDGNSLMLSEYAAATCPDLRTVMMTGSGVFPHGEHGMFAPGVDWVLRKPIPLEDLRAVVAYAQQQSQNARRRVG